MPKIFISYRRADSRKDAGRIYDRLIQSFGKDNVFKDVDSIPLGKDFRGVLREAVAECDVLLAVLGKQWLTIKAEDGSRRLDNPNDFVRIEIESGLQRDKCLVIPVLVDHAPMPNADDLPLSLRELAFKNATIVRDDPDFHKDVNKIISALQEEYQVDLEPTPTQKKVKARGYNVRSAMLDFYDSFDNKDWERAREILGEIRESGKAPKLFDIDTHEQDVWDAIEDEQRDDQYDYIRLMAERGNAERTLEALEVFQQDFPDYDPDNIGEQLRDSLPQTTNEKDDVVMIARETTELASAGAVRAIIGDPFDWCDVPAGDFLYGNDNEKRSLPAYAIAKYPITYSQYQTFIDAKDGFHDSRWWEGLARGKPNQPGDQRWKVDNHPRENVSWYDALAFCRWLSHQLGGGFDLNKVSEWLVRLPTDYEWEKAARGTEGLPYPYGNEFDKTKSNTKESGFGKTTPVTQYPQGASSYGVMDMSGNVWEWCLTDYKNPADAAGKENLSNDNFRVLRSGAFDYDDYFARAVSRYDNLPSNRSLNFGFRVVRPPSL